MSPGHVFEFAGQLLVIGFETGQFRLDAGERFRTPGLDDFHETTDARPSRPVDYAVHPPPTAPFR